MFFGDFFGLFREIMFVRLFRYWFETPKQPKKMFFGFLKQTEKQPKQIEFRFVSVRTENKNFIVLNTP
jgi:hypothetical protein